MAQDVEALARLAFDALNRRDIVAFIELLDPEVEFESLVAEAEGTVFRGAEGVRQWWNDVVASLGGIGFEPVEIRAIGDDSGLTKVRASGEAGGVTVAQTMWQVAIFRDGRPIWWKVCRTEQEALEELERRRAG